VPRKWFIAQKFGGKSLGIGVESWELGWEGKDEGWCQVGGRVGLAVRKC